MVPARGIEHRMEIGTLPQLQAASCLHMASIQIRLHVCGGIYWIEDMIGGCRCLCSKRLCVVAVSYKTCPPLQNWQPSSSMLPSEKRPSCWTSPVKDVFKKHPVGDPLVTRRGSLSRTGNHSRACSRHGTSLVVEHVPWQMFF